MASHNRSMELLLQTASVRHSVCSLAGARALASMPHNHAGCQESCGRRETRRKLADFCSLLEVSTDVW